MKKIAVLPILALLLSCNNTKQTYTRCIETTYNFHKEAINKVIGCDSTEGSFTVEITNDVIKIIDNKGKERLLNKNDGYSLINKKHGDTLVIENLPTENTPLEVLSYGFEYKFYN